VGITAVELFSLPVSDPERARRFYVETLGLELVGDTQIGTERRWIQVRPHGAQTSITLVTWFETMTPGSTKGTVLETDALDADVALLRRRGVAIEGEVQTAPWGRFVTFDDPDGNGIVLQETTGG
jgi:catechol 2,3-dioxygenase-like lactoylglutathione lyase family enzyme